MKYHCLPLAAGLAFSTLPLVCFSQTVLTGDHVIEPGTSDTGSLTVSGFLQVESNYVDLGTTGNNEVALMLRYVEDGAVRRILVHASQEAVEYLWKEGDSDPALADPKMSLGADNALSLYDVGGNATITLSPASGEVSAGGGFRLPDNTLLDGSSALRSTALYNALGQVVAEVDGDGILNVTGGIVLGSNSATKITESGAAYLNDILGKFGYQENPVEPTKVQAYLGGTVLTGSGDLKVVTDASGNRYIAGSFWGGSLILGNATISGVSTKRNQFVVKFSPEGTPLWTKRWSINGGDIYDIAVDTSGNVYMAGTIREVGQSANLSGVTVTTSGNSTDGYVLKLNSSGVGQWAGVIASSGSSYVHGVSVDGSGNVYAAGYYSASAGQSMDLAGVPVTARGGSDGFVFKLNSSGVGQWARVIGSTSSDMAYDIAVDGPGNVYVAGYYSQTAGESVDLAGVSVTARGGNDGFVLKLNSSGVGQWVRLMGSTGSDRAQSVSVDASGNVYVAGYYNRTAGQNVNLAGLTVTAPGGNDGFVLKLNSSGAGQWAVALGGPGADSCRGVSVDSSGNTYVVGTFYSSAGQNMALAGLPVTAVDSINGYILKLDGSAEGQWAKVVPASLSSVYTDDSGELTVCGISHYNNFVLGDAVIAGNETCFVAVLPGDAAPVEKERNGAAELFWGNALSTGASSVALGDNAMASGDYAVSLGKNASATAIGAYAVGSSASASGSYAYVGGGTDNSASGSYASIIGGNWNSASGHSSLVASGEYNSASGYASAVVGGYWHSASGYSAFVAGGDSNYASGSASAVVGGWGNWAMGMLSFVAGGEENLASGTYAFASGRFSQAQAAYSFVVGSSNVQQGDSTTWVSTDDLFVVGNGDPREWGDDRSNALAVHKDGTTRVAGTFEAKGGIRVPACGDIPMGAFTSGTSPADLGAGLRYEGE